MPTLLALDEDASSIQTTWRTELQHLSLAGELEFTGLLCDARTCRGRLLRLSAKTPNGEARLRNVGTSGTLQEDARLIFEKLTLQLTASRAEWLPSGRYAAEFDADWHWSGTRLSGVLRLPRENSSDVQVQLQGAVVQDEPSSDDGVPTMDTGAPTLDAGAPTMDAEASDAGSASR